MPPPGKQPRTTGLAGSRALSWMILAVTVATPGAAAWPAPTGTRTVLRSIIVVTISETVRCATARLEAHDGGTGHVSRTLNRIYLMLHSEVSSRLSGGHVTDTVTSQSGPLAGL